QLSELNEWTIDGRGVAGFRVWQNWVWVQWAWEKPAEDGRVVRFHRRLDLACANYDRIIVNAALLEGGHYWLRAETDAGMRQRRGEPMGPAKREEWLPLDGAQRVTSLTIEAYLPGAASGNARVFWI